MSEMTYASALNLLGTRRVEDLELKALLCRALEKQVAKKPRNECYGNAVTFFHCPSCDEQLRIKEYRGFSVGKEHDFCPHCGQRLDWE